MSSKRKAQNEFNRMMVWAINKMFEQNPEVKISLNDLQKELDKAWNELVEEGQIVIEK